MEIARETLRPEEAQKILGCGRNRIYELIHREDFPSFFIGNRCFISKKKFYEWIETQAENSGKK